MSFGRTLRAIIVFVVLVVLHFTLRPLLGWRAPMDFIVIAVLLAAVRMRPGAAALVGFFTGLAADSLTPEAFGAGALALSGLGFAASWLKAVFFADNLAVNAFYFFLGKWAFDFVYLLAERRMGGVELLTQLLLWSPISAALTAVVGVLLLLLLRPMLEASNT